jgi:hypothetical protein
VGLDGTWLDACALAGLPLDRNTIPLNEFERAHWGLLKRHLPEITEVIGPKATTLLESGRKLEIEAVLHGDRTGLLRRFATERLASFATS